MCSRLFQNIISFARHEQNLDGWIVAIIIYMKYFLCDNDCMHSGKIRF